MQDDTAPDLDTDERPSRIAGRYVVERLIARGGMAVVYLARHADLKRRVALKVLTPPQEDDNPVEFDERFRLEAQTLAALDHPNIVTLHDFGELPDGRCFLAMEYVDGPRLSDLLRSGPLAPERAARLMLQVGSALRYAHRRGVVHRDLKPSNLLIRTLEDGSEQVKVVDFGLVKLTDAEQSITRAGLVLGSPHCMSPEQVKGQEVGPTADIYAIGVLLYRCVTGRYPFHGSSSAATMLAHLNHEVPSFGTAAPELVALPELERVVRRCLEKEPGDRYQDLAELMADLTAALSLPPDAHRTASFATSTLEEAAAARPAPPPPRDGRRVLGAVLAAVLLGAIGLGLGLGLVQSSRDEAPAPAPVAQALPPAPTQAPLPAAPEPPAEPPAARRETPADPAPAAPPAPARVAPRGAPKAAPDPRPAAPAAPTPAPTPAPTAPDGYKGLPEDW